jgi:hypothetical protein
MEKLVCLKAVLKRHITWKHNNGARSRSNNKNKYSPLNFDVGSNDYPCNWPDKLSPVKIQIPIEENLLKAESNPGIHISLSHHMVYRTYVGSRNCFYRLLTILVKHLV